MEGDEFEQRETSDFVEAAKLSREGWSCAQYDFSPQRWLMVKKKKWWVLPR